MPATQPQLFPTEQPLKVLTVRQPWASLITAGIKNIENRSWYTSHRGPLAIHAGKGTDVSDWNETLGDAPAAAIIGIVDVIDCVRDSDSEWAIDGEWHWVLANARPLPQPIPATGKLGLWRLDEETARLVGEIS